MKEDKLTELGEQLLKEVALSETGSIDIMYMLGYIYIQIGDSVAHKIESDDKHELSDLEGALQQLQRSQYIISFGNMSKSYKITVSGREYSKTL